MATIYADHDAPANALIAELHRFGHTVHTSRQMNRFQDRDDQQLAFAARRGWILLTRNAKDFGLLHQAWLSWAIEWGVSPPPQHAGILVIPQNPPRPFPDLASAIHQVLTTLPPVPLPNSIHLWDSQTRTWFLNWQPS